MVVGDPEYASLVFLVTRQSSVHPETPVRDRQLWFRAHVCGTWPTGTINAVTRAAHEEGWRVRTDQGKLKYELKLHST